MRHVLTLLLALAAVPAAAQRLDSDLQGRVDAMPEGALRDSARDSAQREPEQRGRMERLERGNAWPNDLDMLERQRDYTPDGPTRERMDRAIDSERRRYQEDAKRARRSRQEQEDGERYGRERSAEPAPRSPWPDCGPRIPEIAALERRLKGSWPEFDACDQESLAKAFSMALPPSIPQLLGTRTWYFRSAYSDDGYSTKTFVRCASAGFPDDVCGHFSDKIFAARGAAAASHKKAEDALMARVRFEAAGAVQEMEINDAGARVRLEARVLGDVLIQRYSAEGHGYAGNGYFLGLAR